MHTCMYPSVSEIRRAALVLCYDRSSVAYPFAGTVRYPFAGIWACFGISYDIAYT